MATDSIFIRYPIHVAFRPRTRPARPILQDAFLSTLKVAPSEWHQMVVTIPQRRKATVTVEPISCHLIIPSVQTFCLSEPIPFHIQLCGSQESLQHFYGSVPEPVLPGKRPRRRQYAARIRVFLARQIYLEINGRQSWRTITVGEGTLRPIPPLESAHPDADAAEVSVDWDGEVRCKSDVTCGSFSISRLVVKVGRRFHYFCLTPGNVRTSSLLPIQHAHPIRLVTDGWTDQELAHPQDR
ncbi:hypothetical protein B0H14DRAFT_2669328 [Mycena olivaceomarginata]|nr:hypothetical protein B0H14DRAFT_2669328 [Mycena olivaceomarginata]